MIVDKDRIAILKAASAEHCQKCGGFDDNTIGDSRISVSFVRRRRRECNRCGATWRTKETREDVTELGTMRLIARALESVGDLRCVILEIGAAVSGNGEDE